MFVRYNSSLIRFEDNGIIVIKRYVDRIIRFYTIDMHYVADYTLIKGFKFNHTHYGLGQIFIYFDYDDDMYMTINSYVYKTTNGYRELVNYRCQ